MEISELIEYKKELDIIGHKMILLYFVFFTPFGIMALDLMLKISAIKGIIFLIITQLISYIISIAYIKIQYKILDNKWIKSKNE